MHTKIDREDALRCFKHGLSQLAGLMDQPICLNETEIEEVILHVDTFGLPPKGELGSTKNEWHLRDDLEDARIGCPQRDIIMLVEMPDYSYDQSGSKKTRRLIIGWFKRQYWHSFDTEFTRALNDDKMRVLMWKFVDVPPKELIAAAGAGKAFSAFDNDDD